MRRLSPPGLRLRFRFSWLGGALFLSAASVSLANEPVDIREILDAPSIYHLRQVTLRGTVRQVDPIDPYTLQSGTNCYGAYLFTLEESDASISVAVLGICGVPLVKDPDVQEGDRVRVDATIQAPSHGGYNLTLRGIKIVAEEEGTVQAIATRIEPLAD